ncbi:hypothetical protein [uncultured Formosa sp.]|uniref:hypothetical protein n=1 Tax=uncultured Formosa sp. TaxID=255435 RepID=UPI0026175003|nr:hypothetical protein [uncultured Formosa sp.]
MPKTITSLFLSVIFVLFISAPTLITMLKKNADVSMFFSLAEEENSKENVKLISFELNAHNDINYVFGLLETDNSFNFYLNTYSQLDLENVSPPPEYIA